MMLAERIVREAEIAHELATYNELLGRDGELGATLLIEIEDPKERDQSLREWLALPKHLYARLEDGRLIRPTFDERQISDERLSSVHYLRFAVNGQVPTALGCDLPGLLLETHLTPEQKAALQVDLNF
jgi:hypothetical protein